MSSSRFSLKCEASWENMDYFERQFYRYFSLVLYISDFSRKDFFLCHAMKFKSTWLFGLKKAGLSPQIR